MESEHYKFTVIVGFDHKAIECYKYQSFIDITGRKLSRDFGGFTLSYNTGYWLEDASETKDSYNTETLESEMALKYEITVDKSNRETAYNNIKVIFKEVKEMLDFPIQWIHCEGTEIAGLHFEI